MENKEAIKKIERNICGHMDWCGVWDCEKCEVELAIEAIEKMKELEKGLEDLDDILNDAYTLNDFCLNKVILNQPMSECECIAESFSLKVMQNLSWLLDVMKRGDEDEI